MFLNNVVAWFSGLAARPAPRPTGDTVEGLRAQLEEERKKCRQHAFNEAELRKELAIVSREVLRARFELAQRDLNGPSTGESPSTTKH